MITPGEHSSTQFNWWRRSWRLEAGITVGGISKEWAILGVPGGFLDGDA